MGSMSRILAKLTFDEKIVLKDKQREVLLYLAQRKGDLIVNLPVGYGKSIIYHVLPQILGQNTTNPVVLVKSPDECNSEGPTFGFERTQHYVLQTRHNC